MGRLARSKQFVASEVCIVHAVQRCVRRAFLAGVDEKTGKDFSFRREWIRKRMESLVSVFAVDVLSYAILSNHMHLVLRNRPDVVAQWTDEQVALRWLRLFPGRRIDEQLADPTESDVQALVADAKRIAEIRLRLSDISWFMRSLSEPIARLANKEDECTGRFWEGRFKAQRIVDETGLLACSMYVDLNPVRAAMAQTPDEPQHTSAYDRIAGTHGQEIESSALRLATISNEEAAKEMTQSTSEERKTKRAAARRNATGRIVRRDSWLAPVCLGKDSSSLDPQVHTDGLRPSDKGFLNIDLQSYLDLLRWTASQGASGASQAIDNLPSRVSQLLNSMGIAPEMWRDLVWNFRRYFGRSAVAGRPESQAADAQRRGRRNHAGQAQLTKLFAPATT